MRKFLLIFLVCLTSYSICHAGSSPKDFLGPLPDYVYYYQTEHGQKMTLHGLTWDHEGAIVVEQTTFFPDDPALADNCVDQLSTVYVLYADGGRLMWKGFGLVQNGYKVQFDLENPIWDNPLRGPDGEKVPSECRIVETSRQQLFGKERTVIEVAGEFCLPRVYASGIGLIDYAGFRLIRIEKKEASIKPEANQ